MIVEQRSLVSRLDSLWEGSRLLKAVARVLVLLLVPLGAVLWVGARPASAACTLVGAVWDGSNSNWNNALNWLPPVVPNSSILNVCIGNGSTVTLDLSPSVDSLEVDSGNTLNWDPGEQLTTNGAQIIDGGQITINGGGGSNSFLILNASATLSGGGTLTLTQASGGGSSFLEQGVSGVTLTNTNDTIDGAGSVGNGGLTLDNESIVNANTSGGTLVLNASGGITNTGTLEASNGGALSIGDAVNNNGGQITANTTGTVVISNTTVQGGTLTQAGTGVLETSGTSLLDGSTHGAITLTSGSTYTTPLSAVTELQGTINNDNGNFQVNGGAGNNTFLGLEGNTTLQGTGGGTVTLSTAGGGGSSFIEQLVGGLTLTNVNNTIQGAGIIGNGGLTLVNEAIVNANVSGGTLTLNGSGGITNTDLLEATGGGTLAIVSTTVNNAGGQIAAGSGGTVTLNAVTVDGGEVTAAAGATFIGDVGTATLDGSTASGAVTINGGTFTVNPNADLFLDGSIVNDQTISVLGGGGNNTFILAGESTALTTTLSGGGTINLVTSTVGGGGNAVLEQAVSGVTLVNTNNTIAGEGIFGNNGLSFTNQTNGVVDANSSGVNVINSLTLNAGGTWVNQGLMEATNSGNLVIENTIDNQNGNITANGATATVSIQSGAAIQGGTLTNNGGTLGTPNSQSSTLDGTTEGAITLNGTYTTGFNAETTAFGTINNNNTFQVNGGAGNNTFLLIGTSGVPTTTFQGGGTINLFTSTTGGGGDAFIEQSVGGLTLVNANNTIEGEGIFGNNGLSFTNDANGIVDANSSGSGVINSLTIDGGGTWTNEGLMEATNNGVLVIQSNTINNAGANITANGAGATVELDSGDVQGGTLNTVSGGTWELVGSPTLDGTTSGVLTISSGSTVTATPGSEPTLVGTINNAGNFQVNGGGGSNTAVLLGNGTAPTVTLEGSGTLDMNTSTVGGGGNAIIEQALGGVTLVNENNTIQGEGIIGNNGLSFTNDASGILDANSSGSGVITTLQLDGGGTWTNQGLMEATNNGVLLIQNTINNTGGNITANGAGATVELDSGDVQGGTLNTVSGGTWELVASPTLDGTTNGALTISSGSTVTATLGSDPTLLGTINNEGNFQINGGAGNNTEVFVGNNVTLEGGGTVTLNTEGGGGGSPFILQSAGGLTLENVNNTIQGSGIIGDNGLSVTNDAAGLILANQSGQTLEFDSSGSLTNNGTLEVNVGSGMLLASGFGFTNFSGNTLTGGTYIVNGTTSAATLQIFALGTTGGEIVNNAASITLNGPNAMFLDGGGLNALSNLASVTAAGSFTVEGGQDFTTTAALSNAGTVDIADSTSTINVGTGGTQAYTQSGAGLTTVNGTLNASSVAINGGTLQGTGTVNSPVTVTAGTVQPGAPGAPGTLTENGTYHQTGGTFSTQISSAVDFGALSLTSGNVTLGAGASLLITDVNGFNPSGDTFTIMNDPSGSVSGVFDNAPAGAEFSQSGENWTIAYNPKTVVLDGLSPTGSLVTATWSTVSGNWTTPAEWACNPANAVLVCMPNNNAFNVYAAVIDSPGNTLTLSSASSPSAITINTLALTAGTLNIAAGGTLNLVNQPGGITDIPSGVGLTVGGTFEMSGDAASSPLAGLSSIEGTLIVDNAAALDVTPGSGTLTVANTGELGLDGSTPLTITGNLTNSGFVRTNVNNSGSLNDSLTVTGTFTNEAGATFQLGFNPTTDHANIGTLVNDGTVDTGPGSTLSLTNQPNGITDVVLGSTFSIGGSFTTGANTGFFKLGSIEGTLALVNGQSQTATPGTGTLTVASTGTLNLDGSTTFDVSGNLDNFGTVRTNANNSSSLNDNLAVSGTFTTEAGATTQIGFNPTHDVVTALTYASGGTTNVASGALLGVGSGTFTATSGYQQLSNGTLDELISSGSTFGKITPTNNVLLNSGATLDITLLNAFDPVGDSFTIINTTGGSVSGVYANAPSSGFVQDGINWTIAYNPTDIVLDAVSQVGSGVTATWSTVSGNWTTAAEWSCSPTIAVCVPNNGGNTFTAVLDSPGNTLSLNTSSSPDSITINNLSMTAGTLDIGAGATLNLVAQPGGITDINANSGLILAGTFQVNGSGTTSALSGLTSVEGTLTGIGENIQTTPGAGTFTNSGTVNLQNGSTLGVTGAATNNGTINMGNGVADTGNNSFTVSGILTNNDTINMDAVGDSMNADLNNSGPINMNASGQAVTDTGDFNNNSGGQLNVNAATGKVTVAGNFNNNTGASLNFNSGSSGSSLSTTGAFNNSGGTFSMVGSGDSVTAGTGFTNSAGGSVLIGAGESVSTGGTSSYTQNDAASSTEVDGTLSTVEAIINAGHVTGSGQINGSVVNAGGNIEPIDPFHTSTLTISGPYTQNLGGLLTIDLGGTGAGEFSVLDVTGAASLDGTVDFKAVNGFTPAIGDDFTFMDYGSHTGTFSSVDFTGFSCPGKCTEVYGATSATFEINKSISPTPEPGSLVLFGIGGLGMLDMLRRRRSAR